MRSQDKSYPFSRLEPGNIILFINHPLPVVAEGHEEHEDEQKDFFGRGQPQPSLGQALLKRLPNRYYFFVLLAPRLQPGSVYRMAPAMLLEGPPQKQFSISPISLIGPIRPMGPM
ncbi:MAG: hypothetical protein KKD44_01280, partial [Proteobacteria bacterium]|nr:hypothetical protein [Pseudomonadota bacterium]